ncbi:hypothetical protein C471_13691 [Halorubrum saccharovorum DSM 1137]|uniref:Uncharacterized protein n=1 Tax=Halorubrum saccharovorum DSM 1137 TaxID=1227484 RepID=M0DNB8_9EURY|nr:hypothetical protein C471_13691 [Halorubrum saccharovorum DSM 1137]
MFDEYRYENEFIGMCLLIFFGVLFVRYFGICVFNIQNKERNITHLELSIFCSDLFRRRCGKAPERDTTTNFRYWEITSRTASNDLAIYCDEISDDSRLFVPFKGSTLKVSIGGHYLFSTD